MPLRKLMMQVKKGSLKFGRMSAWKICSVMLKKTKNVQSLLLDEPELSSFFLYFIGTQQLTTVVQWLVYFIFMWQSLCKLSDSGLEWLLQFLFQFLEVLSDLSGCEYREELLTIIPSSL